MWGRTIRTVYSGTVLGNCRFFLKQDEGGKPIWLKHEEVDFPVEEFFYSEDWHTAKEWAYTAARRAPGDVPFILEGKLSREDPFPLPFGQPFYLDALHIAKYFYHYKNANEWVHGNTEFARLGFNEVDTMLKAYHLLE